jgi:hypothetical protein
VGLGRGDRNALGTLVRLLAPLAGDAGRHQIKALRDPELT